MQVTICTYIDFDADDVGRLSNDSQENDAEAVEALLRIRCPQNPGLVDSCGWTVLMAAAGSGALESLKLLVSARADPNKPCTQNGSTATALDPPK